MREHLKLQYTVTNTQDFGNYVAGKDDITEQRKNSCPTAPLY